MKILMQSDTHMSQFKDARQKYYYYRWLERHSTWVMNNSWGRGIGDFSAVSKHEDND